MNTVKKPNIFIRYICIALSAIFFVTNVVGAKAPETGSNNDFWSERKKAVKAAKQYANLPLTLPSPRTNSPEAFPDIANIEQKAKKQISSGIPLPQLKHGPEWLRGLPYAYATLEDYYESPRKDSPTIIFVQDVHGHYEAQQNIANIINNIAETQGTEDRNLKTDSRSRSSVVIGLEGAAGAFDFSPYRAFPNKEINKEIADYFLKSGLISGPEYAGLVGHENITFWGVEDKDSYLANIEAFKEALPLRDNAKKQIEIAVRRLVEAKNKVYSPEMLALDDKIESYRNGALSLGEYLEYLTELNVVAQFTGGEALSSFRIRRRYPNVSQFLETFKLEKTINFQKVEDERRILIEKLVNVLGKEELENLVYQAVAHRMGNIDNSVYYHELENICQKHDLKLNNWPELARYVRYSISADKIDRRALYKEINELEKHVVFAFIGSDAAAKKTYEISIQLSLISKLIDNNLTDEEWNTYKKSGVGNSELGVQKLEVFGKFYEVATSRNHTLIENLLEKMGEGRREKVNGNDDTISLLPSPVSTPLSVLVAGGFHTQAMAKILKDRKISYAILSPKLTEIDTIKGAQYLEAFVQDRTPLDKLMLGEKIFMSAFRSMGQIPGNALARKFGPNVAMRSNFHSALEAGLNLDELLSQTKVSKGEAKKIINGLQKLIENKLPFIKTIRFLDYAETRDGGTVLPMLINDGEGFAVEIHPKGWVSRKVTVTGMVDGELTKRSFRIRSLKLGERLSFQVPPLLPKIMKTASAWSLLFITPKEVLEKTAVPTGSTSLNVWLTIAIGIIGTLIGIGIAYSIYNHFKRTNQFASGINLLINTHLLSDLHQGFDVPNYPLHVHREGPTLRHHVQAMLNVLNNPLSYPEIPVEYQAMMADTNYRLVHELYILLHDIGKTKTEPQANAEGLMVYPNHERVSAQMVIADARIGNKLPDELRKVLIETIRLHGDSYQLGAKEIDQSSFLEFVKQIDPTVDRRLAFQLLITGGFLDTIATFRNDSWVPRIQRLAKAYEQFGHFVDSEDSDIIRNVIGTNSGEKNTEAIAMPPGTAPNPLRGLQDSQVRNVIQDMILFYNRKYQQPVPEELIVSIIDTLTKHVDDLAAAINAVYAEVTDPRQTESPIAMAYNNPSYRTQVGPKLQLDLIRQLLPDRGVIVNVGAGNNALAEYIVSAKPGITKYIGTDVSEKNVAKSTDPRIEFRKQESEYKLPIKEEEKADVVIMIYALHHAGAATIALVNEAYRILKPGGRLIILEDTWSDQAPAINSSTPLDNFLSLKDSQRYAVFEFIDWYNNHLIKGYFEMPIPMLFKTLEQWAGFFTKQGFDVEKTEFLGLTNLPFSPKLPLGIIVSKKPSIIPTQRILDNAKPASILGWKFWKHAPVLEPAFGLPGLIMVARHILKGTARLLVKFGLADKSLLDAADDLEKTDPFSLVVAAIGSLTLILWLIVAMVSGVWWAYWPMATGIWMASAGWVFAKAHPEFELNKFVLGAFLAGVTVAPAILFLSGLDVLLSQIPWIETGLKLIGMFGLGILTNILLHGAFNYMLSNESSMDRDIDFNVSQFFNRHPATYVKKFNSKYPAGSVNVNKQPIMQFLRLFDVFARLKLNVKRIRLFIKSNVHKPFSLFNPISRYYQNIFVNFLINNLQHVLFNGFLRYVSPTEGFTYFIRKSYSRFNLIRRYISLPQPKPSVLGVNQSHNFNFTRSNLKLQPVVANKQLLSTVSIFGLMAMIYLALPAASSILSGFVLQFLVPQITIPINSSGIAVEGTAAGDMFTYLSIGFGAVFPFIWLMVRQKRQQSMEKLLRGKSFREGERILLLNFADYVSPWTTGLVQSYFYKSEPTEIELEANPMAETEFRHVSKKQTEAIKSALVQEGAKQQEVRHLLEKGGEYLIAGKKLDEAVNIAVGSFGVESNVLVSNILIIDIFVTRLDKSPLSEQEKEIVSNYLFQVVVKDADKKIKKQAYPKRLQVVEYPEASFMQASFAYNSKGYALPLDQYEFRIKQKTPSDDQTNIKLVIKLEKNISHISTQISVIKGKTKDISPAEPLAWKQKRLRMPRKDQSTQISEGNELRGIRKSMGESGITQSKLAEILSTRLKLKPPIYQVLVSLWELGDEPIPDNILQEARKLKGKSTNLLLTLLPLIAIASLAATVQALGYHMPALQNVQSLGFTIPDGWQGFVSLWLSGSVAGTILWALFKNFESVAAQDKNFSPQPPFGSGQQKVLYSHGNDFGYRRMDRNHNNAINSGRDEIQEIPVTGKNDGMFPFAKQGNGKILGTIWRANDFMAKVSQKVFGMARNVFIKENAHETLRFRKSNELAIFKLFRRIMKSSPDVDVSQLREIFPGSNFRGSDSVLEQFEDLPYHDPRSREARLTVAHVPAYFNKLIQRLTSYRTHSHKLSILLPQESVNTASDRTGSLRLVTETFQTTSQRFNAGDASLDTGTLTPDQGLTVLKKPLPRMQTRFPLLTLLNYLSIRSANVTTMPYKANPAINNQMLKGWPRTKFPSTSVASNTVDALVKSLTAFSRRLDVHSIIGYIISLFNGSDYVNTLQRRLLPVTASLGLLALAYTVLPAVSSLLSGFVPQFLVPQLTIPINSSGFAVTGTVAGNMFAHLSIGFGAFFPFVWLMVRQKRQQSMEKLLREKSFRDFESLIDHIYTQNLSGIQPDGIDLVSYPPRHGKYAVYYLLKDIDQAGYYFSKMANFQKAATTINKVLGNNIYDRVTLKPIVFFDGLERLRNTHESGTLSGYSGVEGMLKLARGLVIVHKSKYVNLGTLFDTFSSKKGRSALAKKLNVETIDISWEKIDFPYDRLARAAEELSASPDNYTGVAGMLKLAKWLAEHGETPNLGTLFSAFGGERAKPVIKELTGKDFPIVTFLLERLGIKNPFIKAGLGGLIETGAIIFVIPLILTGLGTLLGMDFNASIIPTQIIIFPLMHVFGPLKTWKKSEPGKLMFNEIPARSPPWWIGLGLITLLGIGLHLYLPQYLPQLNSYLPHFFNFITPDNSPMIGHVAFNTLFTPAIALIAPWLPLPIGLAQRESSSIKAINAAKQIDEQMKNLFLEATDSQGEIEVQPLEKDGKSFYMVRTHKGIFRFETKSKTTKRGVKEYIRNEAGNKWIIDENNGIKRIKSSRRLIKPVPFLLSDNFLDAWTYKELPEMAEKVINRIIKDNSYDNKTLSALKKLQDEINAGDKIEVLPKNTKGNDTNFWNKKIAKGIIGKEWNSDLPQMLTVSYFFRLVLEKINYWETKQDPYALDKEQEINSALENFPNQIEQFNTSDNKLEFLLLNALWGNKYDPSNSIGEGNILIIDDSEQIISKFKNGEVETVDYEADNAASEILADLWLIHYLLKSNLVKTVNLHVKNYPYAISDATEEDVEKTISLLRGSPNSEIKRIGEELFDFKTQGRLAVKSNRFSTTGLPFISDSAGFKDRLISSLKSWFSYIRTFKISQPTNISLRIMKGDVNYRRITNNRYWGIDQNVQNVVLDPLKPVIILRAAKNQVVVGADKSVVASLYNKDPQWYRKGMAGLIQLIDKRESEANKVTRYKSKKLLLTLWPLIAITSLAVTAQALGYHMPALQHVQSLGFTVPDGWQGLVSLWLGGSAVGTILWALTATGAGSLIMGMVQGNKKDKGQGKIYPGEWQTVDDAIRDLPFLKNLRDTARELFEARHRFTGISSQKSEQAQIKELEKRAQQTFEKMKIKPVEKTIDMYEQVFDFYFLKHRFKGPKNLIKIKEIILQLGYEFKPPIKDVNDQLPIKDLGLSPVVRKPLEKANIDTLGELLQVSKDDLISEVTNLGPERIKEIEIILKLYDRKLSSSSIRNKYEIGILKAIKIAELNLLLKIGLKTIDDLSDWLETPFNDRLKELNSKGIGRKWTILDDLHANQAITRFLKEHDSFGSGQTTSALRNVTPLEWARLPSWDSQYMGYEALGLQAKNIADEPRIAAEIKQELIRRANNPNDTTYHGSIRSYEWKIKGRKLTYYVLVDPTFRKADDEAERFNIRLEKILGSLPANTQRDFLKQFNKPTNPFVRARLSSARYAVVDHLANGFEGIRHEVFSDDVTFLRSLILRLAGNGFPGIPDVSRRRIEVLGLEDLRRIFLDIADSHELRHELLINEHTVLKKWGVIHQPDATYNEVLAAFYNEDFLLYRDILMREIESNQSEQDIRLLDEILTNTTAGSEELRHSETTIRKFINEKNVPFPFNQQPYFKNVLNSLKNLYTGNIDEWEGKRHLWSLRAAYGTKLYRLSQYWIDSAVSLMIRTPMPQQSTRVFTDLLEPLVDDATNEDLLEVEYIIHRELEQVHTAYVLSLNNLGQLPEFPPGFSERLEKIKLKPAYTRLGFNPEFLDTVIRLSLPVWEQVFTVPVDDANADAEFSLALKDLRAPGLKTGGSHFNYVLSRHSHLLPKAIELLDDPDSYVRETASRGIDYVLGNKAVFFLEQEQLNVKALETLFWGYLEMGWRLLLNPPEGFESLELYKIAFNWANEYHSKLHRLLGISDIKQSERSTAIKRKEDMISTIFPVAPLEHHLRPERFFIALRHGAVERLVEYLVYGGPADLPLAHLPDTLRLILSVLEYRFETEPSATQRFILDFLVRLGQEVRKLKPSLPKNTLERISLLHKHIKADVKHFTKHSEGHSPLFMSILLLISFASAVSWYSGLVPHFLVPQITIAINGSSIAGVGNLPNLLLYIGGFAWIGWSFAFMAAGTEHANAKYAVKDIFAADADGKHNALGSLLIPIKDRISTTLSDKLRNRNAVFQLIMDEETGEYALTTLKAARILLPRRRAGGKQITQLVKSPKLLIKAFSYLRNDELPRNVEEVERQVESYMVNVIKPNLEKLQHSDKMSQQTWASMGSLHRWEQREAVKEGPEALDRTLKKQEKELNDLLHGQKFKTKEDCQIVKRNIRTYNHGQSRVKWMEKAIQRGDNIGTLAQVNAGTAGGDVFARVIDVEEVVQSNGMEGVDLVASQLEYADKELENLSETKKKLSVIFVSRVNGVSEDAVATLVKKAVRTKVNDKALTLINPANVVTEHDLKNLKLVDKVKIGKETILRIRTDEFVTKLPELLGIPEDTELGVQIATGNADGWTPTKNRLVQILLYTVGALVIDVSDKIGKEYREEETVEQKIKESA